MIRSPAHTPSALGIAGVSLCLALSGCLQGDDETMHCGVMQVKTLSKVLTPGDRTFELSTATEDSAFTDGLCSVQFQIGFGFENDSLQALALADGPLAMPLSGFSIGATPDIFFMNDSQAVFGGWHTYNRPYQKPGFDSASHYLSTFPTVEGPARRGTYAIRLSLSPSVASADSAVRVSARIRYHTGSNENGDF